MKKRKTEFRIGWVKAKPIGENTYEIPPINPETSEPYFTINTSGWGGGWTAGPTTYLEMKEGKLKVRKQKTFLGKIRRLLWMIK